MKNVKKFSAVLLAVILALLFCTACTSDDAEPEVLEAKTIEISSPSELQAASQYVGVAYSKYTLRLTADIDLTEVKDANGEVVSWTPIGNTLSNAFMGTFDGNGHTVTGLTVTGWDYDGTPKYIAKRILGWTGSGKTVYQSKELVSLSPDENGKVTDDTMIYEGDNDDPDYEDMEENGKTETLTSFGSVGLFGYTKKATIKNVTFTDADISFYGSGKYVYAGFVSGFDVASTFEEVHVTNSVMKVASLREQTITYYTQSGAPSTCNDIKNVTTQYIGGIVGYAKESRETKENGEYSIIPSTFKQVSVNNIVLDNHTYVAYFDAELEIKSIDSSDKSTNYLYTPLTGEKGKYNVSSVSDTTSVPTNYLPEYAFIGGIGGYFEGSVLKDVSVDRLNETSDIKKTAHSLMARSLNAAGLCGAFINGKCELVSASNVYLSAVQWDKWAKQTTKTGGLVSDKGVLGGAFSLMENATVNEATVSEFYGEVYGGSNVKNVCIGGFAAYCYGNTSIDDVAVSDTYMYSNYQAKGEIATLFGGLVAVLRDGTVTNCTAENSVFDVGTYNAGDYVLTSCLVAQVYGNSTYNNCSAQNCATMTSRTEKTAFTTVKPQTIANNNYVNEDGENSIRLYYSPKDGKYEGVYVTVYGNLVKIDVDGNYLYDETIYIPFGSYASYSGEITHPDTFIGGNIPDTGVYFYKAESGWNRIKEDTADIHKSYSADKVYAYAKEVYRVGLAGSMIGKAIPADTYYEYNKDTGSYGLTSDSHFVSGKDYYIEVDENKIASYELEITVYSESDDVIVVRKGKTEDDDVLAKATYAIEKSVYDGYRKEYTDAYGTVTSLCQAEICLDSYFKTGDGFFADKNGLVISSCEGKDNRNFASYIFVDGRPVIDATTIR